MSRSTRTHHCTTQRHACSMSGHIYHAHSAFAFVDSSLGIHSKSGSNGSILCCTNGMAGRMNQWQCSLSQRITRSFGYLGTPGRRTPRPKLPCTGQSSTGHTLDSSESGRYNFDILCGYSGTCCSPVCSPVGPLDLGNLGGPFKIWAQRLTH
jgi:hypothetical protein